MKSILVAGGAFDPNICYLSEQAERQGMEVVALIIGEDTNHSLEWDMATNTLRLDDRPIQVNAAFTRHDVFHSGGTDAHYRASAWHTSISGRFACHPEIRMLNRPYVGCYTNKLQVLRMAVSVGFPIPKTLITNDIAKIQKFSNTSLIAKPVTGGGYCKEADDLLAQTDFRNGLTSCPAIVQEKIEGPDVRIYRIGDWYAGFSIQSDALDYRQSGNRIIKPMEVLPHDLVERLGVLMNQMGMDWGAADFKWRDETFYFLEINSNPMFSVFEKIAQGKISSQILYFLTQHGN